MYKIIFWGIQNKGMLCLVLKFIPNFIVKHKVSKIQDQRGMLPPSCVFVRGSLEKHAS